MRLVKSSRSSSRATVTFAISWNSSCAGMSSHSLLNRTSVASRSRTLNAWSWNVFAFASISSGVRIGRCESRPLGSPTLAV